MLDGRQLQAFAAAGSKRGRPQCHRRCWTGSRRQQRGALRAGGARKLRAATRCDLTGYVARRETSRGGMRRDGAARGGPAREGGCPTEKRHGGGRADVHDTKSPWKGAARGIPLHTPRRVGRGFAQDPSTGCTPSGKGLPNAERSKGGVGAGLIPHHHPSSQLPHLIGGSGAVCLGLSRRHAASMAAPWHPRA